MVSPVLLEPCYLLHARPFRNTSQLLEFFTYNHGKVSAVGRGVKGPRSTTKGLLQQFVPLLVSWSGRGELVTLTNVEAYGLAHPLANQSILCGLYINELLMRLLHRYDAHSQLFSLYQAVLTDLTEQSDPQPVLRQFEKKLLLELGYALELDKEAETGLKVLPEQFYFFDPAHGLSLWLQPPAEINSPNVFLGRNLLALYQDDYSQKEYMRDAKRLLRMTLNRLLGDKPVKSRELFL